MKLSDWMRAKGRSSTTILAEAAGVNRSAIYLIRDGARIPRADTMEKIFVATDGLVGPADYYDMPKINEEIVEAARREIEAKLEKLDRCVGLPLEERASA